MSTSPVDSDAERRRDASQADASHWVSRLRPGLSYRTIGAVYVWVIIIIVFSIWAPKTFPTVATVRQVLNASAVTALIALSLVIPLAAGVFDLSIAITATLVGVSVAYFVVHGIGLVVAVILGVAMAGAVGLINGTVIVVLGVDSFIGTLATGSVLTAIITMITNDIAITKPKLAGGFSDIAQQTIATVTLPVYYVLLLAGILWFLLEHTATGRRLYATGFNAESARLAGVRTNRLRFGSLVASALISGAAGIVLMSSLSTGDPSAGSPYLLGAYTVAFLGATQIRAGRFNALGTVIAVLMLETGVVGLGLVAAPTWASNMFQGLVLIAALVVTSRQRRQGLRRSARMTRLRGKGDDTASGTPSPALLGDLPGNARSADE